MVAEEVEETMTSQSFFSAGTVILSRDILESSYSIFEGQLQHLLLKEEPRALRYIHCLAQLIEAIITHEHLFVPSTYSTLRLSVESEIKNSEIDPIESKFNETSKGLIAPLETDIRNLLVLIEIESELRFGWLDNYSGPIDRAEIALSRSNWLDRSAYLYSLFYDLAFRSTTSIFGETDSKLTTSMQAGDTYNEVTANVLESVTTAVNNVIIARNRYRKDYFRLEVPLVFNYVLEKVRRRDDIIPIALEVRDSKEAKAFREQIALLESATSVGDDKVVGQIIDEIDDKIKFLSKKLDQPTIDLAIAFPLAGEINIGQLAKLVQDQLVRRRKRHLIFIEQLYNSGIHARTIRRHLGKLL